MFCGGVQRDVQGTRGKRIQTYTKVTDNKCSKAVQNYIISKNMGWLLVEPDNHGANAAKQAIQIFKSHFISGLCSIDAGFSLRLWCYSLNQAEITLNLLWTSQADPTKSAYKA